MNEQISNKSNECHYHIDYDMVDNCGVKCSTDTNTIEEVLLIIEYQLRKCPNTRQITLTINK